MRYDLMITGYPVAAEYDDAAVNRLFEPLLRRWARMQREISRRLIVFLAGPPGVGKSTLAAFLERHAEGMPDMPPVQALGMDGFHYTQAYIADHSVIRNGRQIPMLRVKGAPDTFDVEALRLRLRALKKGSAAWPSYDRRLHDVVPDALRAEAPILIVEGNYLLLDAPVWRDLPHDDAVFLRAEEALLRGRLIARKIRGGMTEEMALRFYAECDGPNVRLCLTHSLPASTTFVLRGDGAILADAQ